MCVRAGVPVRRWRARRVTRRVHRPRPAADGKRCRGGPQRIPSTVLPVALPRASPEHDHAAAATRTTGVRGLERDAPQRVTHEVG
eukprot:7259709-Prymnesium_polylepis.2